MRFSSEFVSLSEGSFGITYLLTDLATTDILMVGHVHFKSFISIENEIQLSPL